MVCCVCKKTFIRSVDLTEYYEKKREFEMNVLNVIESLTETELSTKNDEIWDILLHNEALMLLPNYKPDKCNTKNCNALICKFCYKNKNIIICLECKKSP